MKDVATIQVISERCTGCRRCLEVCPVIGAIIKECKGKGRIVRKKCTLCMRCVSVCPRSAIREAGKWISPEEVMNDLISYAPFFRGSDRGGVTLSGGEPLFQPEFTLKLLNLCREAGIGTAIETCGYADVDVLRKAAKNCDLILYDLKHMDEATHIKGTGKSNKLIFENLEALCKNSDTECIVRVPLVSGFNDGEDNINDTAKFVRSLKRIRQIDLLPFNELPIAKYESMGLEWAYENARRQSPEILRKLQDIIQAYGLEATIGGLW